MKYKASVLQIYSLDKVQYYDDLYPERISDMWRRASIRIITLLKIREKYVVKIGIALIFKEN